MTRNQRRIHGVIWTVLGPLLVLAFVAVLAARPTLIPADTAAEPTP